MPSLRLSDFSGGLNLRDSPSEIAPNETANALNWTLDQRGAVQLRKGWSSVVALPGKTGTAAFPWFSAALNLWLCVRTVAGAPDVFKLFSRPADLSGSWTDRGQLLPVATPTPIAAFVDWPGTTPLVVLTAQTGDGASGAIYTFDGTTLTVRSSTIAGHALAVWQNRVWLGGYAVSGANGNPSRLFACKVGDPTVWTAPDLTTADVRDKDAAQLMGLGLAGGALIVFKRRSAYRVNDSANGSYSTLDAAAGCMGPLAVVPLRGRLYTWGADGFYEWDGVGKGVNVGDKVRPLFATDAALVGGVPALCAGAVEDRALFAYPSAAGGSNDLQLEFDPQHGWLMKHQLASSETVSSFARKEASLYAAVPSADALYLVGGLGPGQDGSTFFPYSYYRTPWLQPNGGKLARIIRSQVEGRRSYLSGFLVGTFVMRVYKDWDTTTYDEYDISGLDAGVNPGLSVTDVKATIIRSLGHARAFALEFGTVPATHTAPTLISSLDLGEPISLER